LFLLLATVQASDQADPRRLVDTTIETLRESLIRDQAVAARDPEYSMALVESIVSPHIDMRLAGRLVLGAHWQEATPTQRDAFVAGLRRLLLRIFALHLSEYSAAEVAYSPTVFKGEDQQRAIVRTQVSRPGTPPVSVDYRLYRSVDGWKVYDVSVVGISLVKTYHIAIAHDVRKYGLDTVIEQINAKTPLKELGAVPIGGSSPAG
jgi:phospholipid transport system substrate-binding protein